MDQPVLQTATLLAQTASRSHLNDSKGSITTRLPLYMPPLSVPNASGLHKPLLVLQPLLLHTLLLLDGLQTTRHKHPHRAPEEPPEMAGSLSHHLNEPELSVKNMWPLNIWPLSKLVPSSSLTTCPSTDHHGKLFKNKIFKPSAPDDS